MTINEAIERLSRRADSALKTNPKQDIRDIQIAIEVLKWLKEQTEEMSNRVSRLKRGT